MKLDTGWKIFRIAVAASLLIHAIAALFVHGSRVQAAPEQRPYRIDVMRIRTPRPTPTPQPPKPIQHPQHHAVAPHRPPIHIVQLRPNHVSGPPNPNPVVSALPGTPVPYDGTATTATAIPGNSATAVTVPAATPKPACSAPDVAARAIEAVTPDTPVDAQGMQAQAKIRVDLNNAGAVVGASVFQSTGNPELDAAALRAARNSTYAPEEHDCKNVPGSYLFSVDFQD